MDGIRRWGTEAKGAIGIMAWSYGLEVMGLEDGVRAVFLQDQSGKKQVRGRSISSIYIYIYLSVYLSIYLSIIYLYLSAYISPPLYPSLSFSLSLSISINQSINHTTS